MSNTHIITVASQKGGVAKTTTSVALAHGLALRLDAADLAVLVDFDPQGHASIALGRDPEPGIFDAYVAGAPISNLIRDTGRPCLDILPGNSRTRTAESVLRAETTMLELMAQTRIMLAGYDYAVIDTPPNGLLQELAIRLADTLVIPVRCEALGLDGVAATLQVAREIGQAVRTIILPTMYDRRLKEHSYNLDLLRESYPGNVAWPVPARVAVAEAVALGRTIWEGNGALVEVQQAYVSLLGRIEGLQ